MKHKKGLLIAIFKNRFPFLPNQIIHFALYLIFAFEFFHEVKI